MLKLLLLAAMATLSFEHCYGAVAAEAVAEATPVAAAPKSAAAAASALDAGLAFSEDWHIYEQITYVRPVYQ